MKLITATRFATCAAYLTCVPYIAGAALCLLLLSVGVAQAQTTQFTYQGRLNDGGNAANGAYDMQFKLFDALSAGAQVGSTVSLTSVNVSGGIFTVTLDFGISMVRSSGLPSSPMRRLPSGSTITQCPPTQVA